jgi:hypothetical protein
MRGDTEKALPATHNYTHRWRCIDCHPGPAPSDEPDPNRLGLPKCPRCGDIAFQPDPVAGRRQAWRCGGCHRTLSHCTCEAAAPSDAGRLPTMARQVLDGHVNADGKCRECGMSHPCHAWTLAYEVLHPLAAAPSDAGLLAERDALAEDEQAAYEDAERLRAALADAVTLASWLNDEMKSRDLLPHYTGIADKTLPRLRALARQGTES